jgi:hypothetical protein
MGEKDQEKSALLGKKSVFDQVSMSPVHETIHVQKTTRHGETVMSTENRQPASIANHYLQNLFLISSTKKMTETRDEKS